MPLPRAVASGAILFLAAATATLLSTPAFAGTRPAPGGPVTPRVAPHATCQQQSFLEGDHYSAVQIAQLARNAGFSGNDWVISVAVAEAESAGWTRARLINTDCSVDRGLWQINSYWHGEVSDSCAFDPPCNAQGTHTIWANGGWTQWTTYNNGAYQSHMAEAQAAVNQVGGGGGGGGGCSSASDWVAGHWYPTGSVVRYNGSYYIATHDNPGYDPTISTWFWSPTSCGGGGVGGGGGGGGGGGSAGTWAPYTAYSAGQTVSYSGHNYRCIQSHTSLPGWEPPNVPALWQAL